MAKEAVEKIKEAEQQSRSIKENAVAESRKIIAKAKDDGKKLLENKVKEAMSTTEEIIRDANVQAQIVINERMDKNKNEKDVLQSIVNRKSDNIADELINML